VRLCLYIRRQVECSRGIRQRAGLPQHLPREGAAHRHQLLHRGKVTARASRTTSSRRWRSPTSWSQFSSCRLPSTSTFFLALCVSAEVMRSVASVRLPSTSRFVLITLSSLSSYPVFIPGNLFFFGGGGEFCPPKFPPPQKNLQFLHPQMADILCALNLLFGRSN